MRGVSRVVVIASSTLLIAAPAAIACSPQDYMSPEDWQALSPAQQVENALGHTHEAESPPPAQGSAPAPAIDAGSVSAEETRTRAAPESSRDDASEARAGLPTDPQEAARFVRQSGEAPKLPEELRAAPPRSSKLVVGDRRPTPRRSAAPVQATTPVEQPSVDAAPVATVSPERATPRATRRSARDERRADSRPERNATRRDVPSRSEATRDPTVEGERAPLGTVARDGVITAAPSTPTLREATDFWPLALLIVALGSIAGLVARRRSDGDSAAVESIEPTLPPDAIEAELQEIIAERHAETLGADAPSAADQRARAAVAGAPMATNSE